MAEEKKPFSLRMCMGNWRENVKKITPYVPGEQPKDADVIKLNTNENPYPPCPGVQTLSEAFSTGILKKYPDPDVTELVNALASYHGVKPSQVFCGVGSDDVLSVAFLTFFAGSRPVLFPDITYAFYPVWAEVYKIPYREVPLGEDLSLLAESFCQENGGIVFPNPNAPTAKLAGLDTVRRIIKENPSSFVIVDEAYIDFAPENSSALPLLSEFDNLLVVRTFSKSRSMAGMRIGYCIGSEEAIAMMNAVKFSINSYTMSHQAILLGTASVKDEAYFKATVEKIKKTREESAKKLKKLHFSGPQSCTNFLWVKHDTIPGRVIFDALREKHIYVRHWDKPALTDYLRITIGTDEEMEKLCEALEEIIKGN